MTTERKNEGKTKIQVDDYGDMIAKLRDMKLLHYECYGSYQGEYLAVLLDEDKPKRIFIYKDYYGSCSGCDWLESEKDWDTGEVDYKEANDFCSQMKPFLILPVKECSTKDFESLYADDYNFTFRQEDAEKICEIINDSISPTK